MNRHLNIFKTYAKTSRSYQLENDLTRALAISLQEDNLFLHEFLKFVLKDTNYFNQFFEDIDGKSDIEIFIQKKTSSIGQFDKIIAVSLSEAEMFLEDFWAQKHDKKYDPICDLIITINEIVIVVEAKRDNVNCTAQLYNQVFNIFDKDESIKGQMKEMVIPIDLSWHKLMEITVKVGSFELATGNKSRFISDFIDLVKAHNFRWLPEPAISSLAFDNKSAIERRLGSAIQELAKSQNLTTLSNRFGFEFSKPWAQEVIFGVTKDGNLAASIYPGNTKGQGIYLFKKEPVFLTQLTIQDQTYEIERSYHIKFTSFQKYFTGLWFSENDLIEDIYTQKNFWRYTGRKKRGADWDSIESFFNRCFKAEFNWKKKCNWLEKVINRGDNKGKNQFDISFGYEINIAIPFQTLKNIDTNKSDLTGLSNLLKSINNSFSDNILVE